MLATLLALALAVSVAIQAAPPPQAEAPERALLVRVADGRELARLSTFDLDVVGRDPTSGAVEVVARPADLERLARAGVAHEVLVEDLAAFYAARLTPGGVQQLGAFGAWLNPPFGQGSMGGYYTFAEVASVLDQIAAAYPSIVAPKASLGTSIEGRSLWMLAVSDNPLANEGEPEVRFDAMHHAREPGSMQCTLWFLLFLVEGYGSDPLATYLVDQRRIFFVPVVNPDGYVHNQGTNPGGGGIWRKNRRNNGDGTRGVDLNRNYAYQWGYDNVGSSPVTSSEVYRGTGPASEPEVAAMQAFLAARQFRTALSTHTHSGLWLYPFGYDALYPANDAQYAEISALATEVNGYTPGPASIALYLANGVTIDHDHALHGTLSWTPEIGFSSDGFWPPTSRIVPLAEENLRGFQVTALSAGAHVRALDVARAEIGDGDGHFEPGESVRFAITARNSGVAGTSTPVVLGLSTASPHASVAIGQHVLGPLAPFTQASNAASPLRLDLHASAPPGIFVHYVVSVAYEGFVQQVPGTLVLGEPVPYVLEDVELDLGWLRGAAGDTATSGRWERGVPIGTTSQGQQVAPGADATPGPGVQAFVTGNGGGAAGDDDVDNGFTTLLSPVFDLSGVGPARLSYARWWADFTTPDDVLAIDLSNDGGATWAALERVGPTANAWTTVEHLVPDVLPQTDAMRLRVVASDDPNNSLVEAGFDDLAIHVFDPEPRLSVFGRGVTGGTVLIGVSGAPGSPYQVLVQRLPPQTASAPFASGPWSARAFGGVIPASRLAQVPVSLPSSPGLLDLAFRYRAVVLEGGVAKVTNDVLLTLQ